MAEASVNVNSTELGTSPAHSEPRVKMEVADMLAEGAKEPTTAAAAAAAVAPDNAVNASGSLPAQPSEAEPEPKAAQITSATPMEMDAQPAVPAVAQQAAPQQQQTLPPVAWDTETERDPAAAINKSEDASQSAQQPPVQPPTTLPPIPKDIPMQQPTQAQQLSYEPRGLPMPMGLTQPPQPMMALGAGFPVYPVPQQGYPQHMLSQGYPMPMAVPGGAAPGPAFGPFGGSYASAPMPYAPTPYGMPLYPYPAPSPHQFMAMAPQQQLQAFGSAVGASAYAGQLHAATMARSRSATLQAGFSSLGSSPSYLHPQQALQAQAQQQAQAMAQQHQQHVYSGFFDPQSGAARTGHGLSPYTNLRRTSTTPQSGAADGGGGPMRTPSSSSLRPPSGTLSVLGHKSLPSMRSKGNNGLVPLFPDESGYRGLHASNASMASSVSEYDMQRFASGASLASGQIPSGTWSGTGNPSGSLLHPTQTGRTPSSDLAIGNMAISKLQSASTGAITPSSGSMSDEEEAERQAVAVMAGFKFNGISPTHRTSDRMSRQQQYSSQVNADAMSNSLSNSEDGSASPEPDMDDDEPKKKKSGKKKWVRCGVLRHMNG